MKKKEPSLKLENDYRYKHSPTSRFQSMLTPASELALTKMIQQLQFNGDERPTLVIRKALLNNPEIFACLRLTEPCQ